MELFTTIPTKLVSPTNAVKEKLNPVICRATIEPMIACEIASDEDEEDDENDLEYWIENQEEENIDFENDIAEIKFEREYWRTRTLKKVILETNQETGGQVIFSRDIIAKYFKICINIQSSEFEFLYQQKRTN